jgi:hypothetical protein
LQKIKVYAKQKVSTSTVDEDDWGWQASGLKQKDYCRVNQIAYHFFHYWYGLYRANRTDTGSFLPVKVVQASHTEHITILGVSGIKVQVALTDQSIAFVKQLLQTKI